MAPPTAWLCFFGPDDPGFRSRIVESLAQAGVHTCRLDPDVLSGSGIVVFDELTSGLCEFR